MKRSKFISQYTRKTKSDHEALFVLGAIRSLKHPKWVLLKFCSANLGGHFDRRDMVLIVKEKPDIIAVQEAGDQQWIISLLREHGYRLVDEPVESGQASTLTFHGPRVKVRDASWVMLLEGGYDLGLGTGPDDSKAKWWNRNTLEVEGVRFGASSWHATADQGYDKRFHAARSEASVWINAITSIRRPMFVIGDSNSDTSERLTKWITERKITGNQQELNRLATHGTRAIDCIYTQKSLVA